MTERREIPVRMKYSDKFSNIYATGAVGGFNGYDFRIAFFVDRVVHPEDPSTLPTGVREIQTEVLLSLRAAKELRDWLDTNIKEIEKSMGEIKKPEVGQPVRAVDSTTKPYG